MDYTVHGILQARIPVAQLVKNPLAMQETPVWFLGWEDPLEKGRLPTPVFLGFSSGSAGKEYTWLFTWFFLGSIPELGRYPGEVQYSGLENSMDYIVHAVAKLGKIEQLSLSTG